MEASGAAVQVTQSKRYGRFHKRRKPDAPYEQVALDLARA